MLNSISLDLAPVEKLGIVSRTGAGKSSVFIALFQVRELAGGCVEIDSVNTSTIGLELLRSRLTISQEPALFAGSLSYNLDILREYSDADVWEALTQAHLANFVRGAGGLDRPVTDRGECLSAGQRQLVCLARALLRRPRVLLLDEATAFVDAETDMMIQRTVHSVFKLATVITVAHRLLTIADSKRVLVLDKGKVKELAAPQALLEDESSLFASLVRESGGQADLLRQLALKQITLKQLGADMEVKAEAHAAAQTQLGDVFNDAYQYMDWLLTVHLLLVENPLAMNLDEPTYTWKSWMLGLSSALMIITGHYGEL